MKDPIPMLARTSLVLVILLVAISSYLRLDHSGIGCEPWPACYGNIGIQGAAPDIAWVPTVRPETLGPDDPNPYAVHGEKNIHRALGLVPAEVRAFFDLDVELYLTDQEIRDFDREPRALDHAQIELLAGRVSALRPEWAARRVRCAAG